MMAVGIINHYRKFGDSLITALRYLWRTSVHAFRVTVLLAIVVGIGFALWEMRTSTIQARLFTEEATKMSFQTAAGPSPAIRFPRPGPFDVRRGYSKIPDFLQRLTSSGYEIDSQVRFSRRLYRATELGLSPPYREKQQAGLRILDRKGETVFDTRHPLRVYESFDEVPPLVVTTLLYIENRELLDMRHPKRNPTVEWDRLALAVMELLSGPSGPDGRGPGGSTLATQIEKIRHSPGGWTKSPREKLRQMLSASLRIYRDGPQTYGARKRLVVEYLNSLPLAAVNNHGEVIGLADGLRSWYAADFEKANKLLRRGGYDTPLSDRAARAKAYKQVLSLLIAQRRPRHYLIDSPKALASLTNTYMRLLTRDGVITPEMRDLAAATDLALKTPRQSPLVDEDWEPDTADIVRAPLVSRLGLPGFYQLDRLDLTVQSSLDQASQERVTQTLRDLGSLDRAKEMGLTGRRMLGRGDPAKVEYSFTLYERGNGVNWLRLQASNLDQPFNLSDGARLDLGSTAKLRTMANYLQIFAALHKHFAGDAGAAARKAGAAPSDRLARWALARLTADPSVALGDFLDAALERRYSASPEEMFFTGGGLHAFRNFDRKDDQRTLSVRESFRRSVNLVFIRMMRDIVRYHRAQLPDFGPGMFRNTRDPRRRIYLERFAHHEGRIRLSRLYKAYAGKSPEEAFKRLSRRSRSPKRLAAMLRFIEPKSSLAEFESALKVHTRRKALRPRTVKRLYETMSADRHALSDISYIARSHPLELWLVAYLRRFPEAKRADVLRDSAAARVDAYRWLFRARSRRAQNLRIQTMLEKEAFRGIAKDWQRLGYPFDLVPSYATSLGSSADRPAALAELVGVIVNGGVRHPTHRVSELHFARGTPYETVVVPRRGRSERVMPAEVAATLRKLMEDTVEQGTAKRAHGALVRKDGQPIKIGGKTGTGDHRYKIFARGARLIGERVVSRSATFVFLIGDRYYGVVTAHVLGRKAAKFNFTSALAVQLFTKLAPQFLPVIDPSGVTVAAKSQLAKHTADESEAAAGPIQVESTLPGASAAETLEDAPIDFDDTDPEG